MVTQPGRAFLTLHGDIALLQEAGAPPESLAGQVEVDPAPFQDTEGKIHLSHRHSQTVG